MNEPTIEFWYDFASPYCYLAASRLERLAAGKPLRLAWRPFLLGPIFKQRSHDPSPFQNPSPAERRYRWRDVVLDLLFLICSRGRVLPNNAGGAAWKARDSIGKARFCWRSAGSRRSGSR
jgi:2-hydroxychromene-2-carboxylate isomerase